MTRLSNLPPGVSDWMIPGFDTDPNLPHCKKCGAFVKHQPYYHQGYNRQGILEEICYVECTKCGKLNVHYIEPLDIEQWRQ